MSLINLSASRWIDQGKRLPILVDFARGARFIFSQNVKREKTVTCRYVIIIRLQPTSLHHSITLTFKRRKRDSSKKGKLRFKTQNYASIRHSKMYRGLIRVMCVSSSHSSESTFAFSCSFCIFSLLSSISIHISNYLYCLRLLNKIKKSVPRRTLCVCFCLHNIIAQKWILFVDFFEPDCSYLLDNMLKTTPWH